MELKLVLMAFEGLSKRVDDIMKENQSLKNEIRDLRKQIDLRPTESPVPTTESKSEDELNSDYIEKLLQKEKEERLKKQETKE